MKDCTKDIEIISQQTLYQGFFKMVKYQFRHTLFNGGWSEVIDRELFVRGNAVALLPYDPATDQVVIIEQIRVGALHDSSPWQLEIVAGVIDTDESSEQVARRETVEEAGIEVGQLNKISSFYPSSGGCSEKLDVFVGQVDASKAQGVHGLAYEGEDIKVHVMSRIQAYQAIQDGRIENAASIIALQWLEMNYKILQEQWLLK